MNQYPVLYSFRRCPYAMRARLAITSTLQVVELREIELRNKPEALHQVSPKATVPVLVLTNGQVIDQSLDIMRWALQQNDPEHWLAHDNFQQTHSLIEYNDVEFKQYLDRYKYPERFPDHSVIDSRLQAESFLALLEQRLNTHAYLCDDRFTLADAAILPFIRQFAAVDKTWFAGSQYVAVRQWLNQFLASDRFNRIMTKYEPWNPAYPILVLL